MGRLLNIVTPLHTRTARAYLARMNDDKVEAMTVARRFDADYWDGPRRYGYGGYRDDGRWKPVAQALVETYQLPPMARILDVGCGKAFLLHEFRQLLPAAEVAGFDASAYAVAHAKEEVRERVRVRAAQDPFPEADGAFDLVVSLNVLHNLRVFELERALREIERVGRRKYIVVESYRTPAELLHLQCWALTCETFFDPDAWRWLFDRCGYTGDYEFIYFD